MFMMIFPLGYSKYFMAVLLNLSPYYVVTLVNPIFIQIIKLWPFFYLYLEAVMGNLFLTVSINFFYEKARKS